MIVINIGHLLRSMLDRSKYSVAGRRNGILLMAANKRATVREPSFVLCRASRSGNSVRTGQLTSSALAIQIDLSQFFELQVFLIQFSSP